LHLLDGGLTHVVGGSAQHNHGAYFVAPKARSEPGEAPDRRVACTAALVVTVVREEASCAGVLPGVR
jgi:hypothetical protein